MIEKCQAKPLEDIRSQPEVSPEVSTALGFLNNEIETANVNLRTLGNRLVPVLREGSTEGDCFKQIHFGSPLAKDLRTCFEQVAIFNAVIGDLLSRLEV